MRDSIIAIKDPSMVAKDPSMVAKDLSMVVKDLAIDFKKVQNFDRFSSREIDLNQVVKSLIFCS
jgi:hypothetical protein